MVIEGYEKLSKGQQKRFDKILRIYLLTQSKTTKIKSVKQVAEGMFLVKFSRDGADSEITLDSKTSSWG
nr:hypothetical protein [uncultured Methanolobus sp.]